MDRPKVGVGVIVLKDGKVLFQKRKGAHGEGTWSFPGGHLEFNESWEECAKRETMEEFGVSIKNVRFAGLTNDIHTSEGKHYITIFMLSELDSGEPRIMEPHRTVEIGWKDWNDMPRPLFLPITRLLEQGYSPLKEKYQHYKGGVYELVGEARHSETTEEMVVYQAEEDSPEFGKKPIWVRPKKMFHENVEINGEMKPRFRKI